MNILKSEYITFWDVDDTIIMHEPCSKLRIKDPLGGKDILVRLNRNMIRLMKEEHHRGATIIVWSRGGYEWATNVIKALELEEYVHTIMSKPLAYFDDKPIEEWLKYRVYLRPDEPYKLK